MVKSLSTQKVAWTQTWGYRKAWQCGGTWGQGARTDRAGRSQNTGALLALPVFVKLNW